MDHTRECADTVPHIPSACLLRVTPSQCGVAAALWRHPCQHTRTNPVHVSLRVMQLLLLLASAKGVTDGTFNWSPPQHARHCCRCCSSSQGELTGVCHSHKHRTRHVSQTHTPSLRPGPCSPAPRAPHPPACMAPMQQQPGTLTTRTNHANTPMQHTRTNMLDRCTH